MKTQAFRLSVVVAGVGVLAIGLSLRLEGAPPSPYADKAGTNAPSEVNRATAITKAKAFVVDRAPQAVPAAASTSPITVGKIPTTGLRVVSTTYVDYRDDRGTRERAAGKLFGPLPSHGQVGGVAAGCPAGTCSFDVECDDGNKCTIDRCLIPAGLGPCVGTCDHAALADGQVGECDDGVFCNGKEHCENGACVAGLTAVCCSTPPNLTACVEAFPRCSAESANPGAGCDSNGDCPDGSCDHCQPACTGDPDCNDGIKCNGAETCDTQTGLCVPGNNPCGAGADCFEGRCTTGTPAAPCNSALDCAPGASCNLNLGPVCFTGRCCTPDTPDPADDQMECSDRRGLATTPPGADPPCSTAGGNCNPPGGACVQGLWYAGDTGRDDRTDMCGGNDTRNRSTDEWGCPKYGRGIAQTTAADAPVYPVTVGPISESTVSVPLPGGPGGPLNQMGDDYTLSNTSHLGLDAMRWAGGALNGNRVSMDFYDASNNFVEDIVLGGLPVGSMGIHLVIFTPSLTIPSSGYVVMRVAEDFEPGTRFVWFSTTDANGTGTNDADKVWVNGAPATGTANFLGAGNGIMAMELVGDKEAGPIGSCCDKDSGECEDGVVSWVCRDRGGEFNGVSSLCASCNTGPSNPAGSYCRRCSNNAAQCTSDASCDVQTQGTCDTGTHLCTAGLPPTTVCNVDDDCDLHFSCDPNSAAGCSTGGAICVAAADCANGACCDPVTGDCTYGTEGSCSGDFKGFGSSCDSDSGSPPTGDEGEQHCCRKPTSLKCMGGPNNLQTCTTHLNCGRCVSDNAECDEHSDCPGSRCDGRCVNRGTGADDCEDAFIHAITVPDQGAPPKVITISGDNSFATSTFADPDTCNAPSNDANADPGWYEAFSTDKCALVRVDRCCSDPVRQPEYPIVITDCYEGCGTTLIYAVNPYVSGLAPFFRGLPYCQEDNLWFTLGLLPGGTYWMPIYAALAGAHGPYQIHVTVEACPAAACCHLECSGRTCSVSGTPCTGFGQGSCDPGQTCSPPTPCTGPGQGTCSNGQTCNTRCDELNQYECDAVQGFYNGPPQIPNPNPQCVGDPCAEGSCCTGPGLCNDSRQNFGAVMTRAICEAPPFNGNFIGGPRCFGGECTEGLYAGMSCNDVSQCNNQGVCSGDEKRAQPNPCPICEIGGADNCQAFDNAFQFAPSDRSYGTGVLAADDFVLPTDGTINTVCVWGYYVDNDPDTTGLDCAGPFAAPPGGGPTNDHFRVRIFADNNGMPGALVGESDCTADRAIISGAITTATYTPPIETYGFQLALTNAIGPLSANDCYWLEVSNDTGATPAQCSWVWTQLDPTSAVGNKYSAGGSVATGYPPGSEKQADQAFCLNTNFLAGGCGDRVRACCTCSSPPVCTEETLEACTTGSSHWQATQSTCAGGFECPVKPPPNDSCATPLVVPVGSYGFQDFCAGTDGYNPVSTDFGSASILNDIWYNFTVPNNPEIPDLTEKCDVVADICPSGLSFDSLLAIYHDPENPTVCPCPQDATVHNATFVESNDENCAENAVGGPAFVVAKDAKPGNCYTIRVGGFPGPNDEGIGQLDISCGPLFCGDNRKDSTEECDGTDDAACPGGCRLFGDPLGGCTCGTAAICGDGTISGREECDPAHQPTPGCVSPATCRPLNDPAGECTCVPFCGNNNIEEGEDCDSAQDAECPDICGAPDDPVVSRRCHCPPLVCGDGVIDTVAGEECETDADCGDEAPCRLPGDPLGGCTCACVAETVPSAPTPVWRPATGWPNTDSEATTRSLRFKVTAPVTATGSPGQSALKVTMINLQDPVPPNLPNRPPPDFSTYESATCTAAGEANGCARWVGKPGTFLESQDNPTGASNRAARLQCTPFYYDWVTETATSPIAVVGAEIAPSSEYRVEAYAVTCKGVETGCADKSEPVTMYTRRSGDAEVPFNPPATSTQPDVTDIAQLVNKFKNVVGAPVKSISQLQPNLPELNADLGALDIVAVVDAVKQFAYAFGGPCACPSAVTCGSTACTSPTVCINLIGAGATCMKTCSGGDNAGDTCINNTHCPGGACGAGFCRDKCGRCTPP